MAYKINHAHVREVIALLQTDNINFDISLWINGSPDPDNDNISFDIHAKYYDTQDHCGTAACVAGHMHMAGMIKLVDIIGAPGYKIPIYYELLGSYLIDSDTDSDMCNTIGRWIGNPDEYDNRDNVGVYDVIERLNQLLDCNLIQYNDNGVYMWKHRVSFVTDPIGKLGLSLNNS